MPDRPRSCRSLIRPASSTVWPVATAIELFTLRCETVGVSVLAVALGGDVADLLLDVEQNIAIDVDPRHHAQDHAGIAIVDVVDDRRARRDHRGCRLGRDRNLVADLKRRDLVVENHDRRRRQNLDVADGAERIEDDARIGFAPEQEVEPGKRPAQHGTGGSVDEIHGPGVRLQPEILALDEILHAVFQRIVERDLGDGRIDRNLQLRPVELVQRLLDDAVVLLIGIDQQRVVGSVRSDPHARQDGRPTRAATTATAAAAEACSRRVGGTSEPPSLLR